MANTVCTFVMCEPLNMPILAFGSQRCCALTQPLRADSIAVDSLSCLLTILICNQGQLDLLSLCISNEV